MHKVALIALVGFAVAGCGTIDIAGNNAPPYTDPGPDAAMTTVGGPGTPPRSCRLRGAGLYALPDAKCSPGALNPDVTQANVASTICKSGWTKTVRPSESVTAPEKRVVFRAYHLSGSLSGYELDHIVSLELGGAANEYANYYDEPDYQKRKGFFLNPKDRLENALNHLVCAHRMLLRVAQRDVSTDWVAAYRRYVK